VSDSIDQSGIDTAASQACTRAGAFALLVSVVLFLLAMYWQNRKNDEALAKYVGSRLNMALQFDSLDKDGLWEEYEQSHPDADHTSIDVLRNEEVRIVERGSGDQNTTGSSSNGNPSRGSRKPVFVGPRLPAPIRDLTVTITSDYEIPEIAELVRAFRELNDPEMLTRARMVGNFFGISIAKWGNRRNNLLYGNVLTHACTVPRLEVVPAESWWRSLLAPPRSAPLIDDDALLKCISLRDLRELANFELPALNNPTELGAKIVRDPEISPGSFPRDPFAASIVSELFLAFVLFYFAAFAREATSSIAFPARGTLFGAFSNSRWQLLVFFLALWAPFLSCLALAVSSTRLVIVLGIVPVLFATLSVQRTLEEKFFFREFRPLTFVVRTSSSLVRSLREAFLTIR